MAYCTIEQLEARYGRVMLIDLSDRDGASRPTAPDDALFARAIADADAAIDGYLAGRYSLPLPAVPALLADLSQRLAIYNAHGSVASDKITRDADAALRQLREIAIGTIRLDVAGAEPEPGQAAEVRVTERERPLSATSLKGFI